MRHIDSFVISTVEPQSTDTAWANPVSDGQHELLLFGKKGWKRVMAEIDQSEVIHRVKIQDRLKYGHLSSTTGNFTAVEKDYTNIIGKRTCSTKYVEIDGRINDVVSITIPNIYRYSIYFYNEDKQFIPIDISNTWSNPSMGNYPVPMEARWMRFLVKRADNEYIAEATITAEYNARRTEIVRAPTNNFSDTVHIQDVMIVPVHSPTEIGTTDLQDNSNAYYPNYGILRLPESYNEYGPATPMIIFCHGYSCHYDHSSTEIASTSNLNVDYLLKEGFAVMDVDGSVIDHTKPHLCSDMAVKAYVQGYDWVVDRFNIRREVYLAGHSEGGLMADMLANLGDSIPTKALALFAPVTSLIHLMQLFPNIRPLAADYYGFEGTTPAWTLSTTFSAAEVEYIYSNFDKFAKAGLFWNRAPGFTTDKLKALNTNFTSHTAVIDPSFLEYYGDKNKLSKVPIKIFQGELDTSCPYQFMAVYYNQLSQTGIPVEVRIMQDVAHTGTDGIVAAGSNTVLTIFGDIVEDVSTSLVEAVRFFRRY